MRGRASNKLTDRTVRAFISSTLAGKATVKKLADGAGLYLIVSEAGTGLWRIKYRHAGKERTYSVGAYPAVSLQVARTERDRVKALIGQGHDPVKARLLSRATAAVASDTTFSSIANAWLAKMKDEWSEIHFTKSKRAIERDVLPLIGSLPIDQIKATMVARVLETIQRRGVAETASKILQHIYQVFQYAKARGAFEGDNPASAVQTLLNKPQLVKRRPAILNIDELRELLRRADVAPLSPSVRLAHRLAAFTAARIGNVVAAQWSEFDLDGESPSWTIPRGQMKIRGRHHDHRMYLGPAIASELRLWRSLIGDRGYVFPSPALKNPHISRESIEKALRVTLDVQGRHSVHGWRSSLATLARDEGFAKEVVDLALDHVHQSDVASTYDRGERREQRIQLALWWDALLTDRPRESNVIPLHPAVA